MYLWKYWRDTRIKFFVFLGIFICLQIAFFASLPKAQGHLDPSDLSQAFTVTFAVIGTVLLFLGWILGDESVGADIGRGSGDFLLTRPQSRGSMVWMGWGLSMIETVVLWLVFFALVVADIASLAARLGLPASVVLSSALSFCAHGLPIMFLTFIVNLGMIFGVTYFIGVVLRSGSKALIGALSLVVGYKILQAILHYRFAVFAPDILLTYPGTHHALASPNAVDFIVRGAVAIAFPVMAHWLLERAEI